MNLNLLDLIGVERLSILQQRFFEATGFANACLDHKGVLLTHAGDTEPFCMELIRKHPIGLKRCQELVKKTQNDSGNQRSNIICCHAGLLDGRIPIRMEEEIVGYLVMGQVLDKPPNKKHALQYAQELKIDPDLYWKAIQKVRIVSREKIEAASQLLEFMGSEIATMASTNLKLRAAIEEKNRVQTKQKQLNAELSQTNKVLQQERERFKLLIDNTLDAIFVTGESGHFKIVNKQACISTGYTEEELLKMHTSDIEIGHTENEVIEILKNLSQGKSHRTYGVHRKKDGTTFPVETVLCRYFSEESINLMAVARDVTERKKAEKEKELLELKLRNAQKLEAIGTLAGGIAHDFNNILSGILGYTELAIKQVEQNNIKQLDERLNKIRQASFRARDLIEQILHFSRENEQLVSQVRLSTVIEETLDFLRSSLPSTIRIELDIDSDIYALINPTEFHQVIMNLCTNAFQAMQSAGGILTVTLRNIGISRNIKNKQLLKQNLEYSELNIEDNGTGIEKEVLERIFEPYYTSKETGEGTGLGLAVVHGLVKNSGGEIVVESTPNVGTCFTVYLPTVKENSLSKTSLSEEQSLPGGSEKIVIVDDDENLVEMNIQILKDLGYRTKAFSNSVSALDYILNNQNQIDLIITDMTMPKMTGLELFEKIREINQNIPVIICSGHSDLISKEQALSIGVKDYLQKPVSIHNLAKSIRKTLDEVL